MIKEKTLEQGKMKKFSVKTKVLNNSILSLLRQLEVGTRMPRTRPKNAQSCEMAASQNSKRISRRWNRNRSKRKRGAKAGYNSKKRRNARSKESRELRSR